MSSAAQPANWDAWDDEGEFLSTHGTEKARTVRPYTVTGGRTRSADVQDLPVEALVRAIAPAPGGMSSERRRILDLTGERILSVAELSAYMSLPLGVIRVLVGDLSLEGLLAVQGGAQESVNPATDLSVLESVLNGISAL